MPLLRNRPCHLELTTSGPNHRCACNYYAHEHPYWPHKNPKHVNYSKHVAAEYDRLLDETVATMNEV